MDFMELTKDIVGSDNVFINEKMDKHTTMRVGGNASCLVTPETVEALVRLINILKEKQVPYYVIGNGSNLLVSDSGFDGIIIKIGRKMSNITQKDNVITVEAGALMSSIGGYALKEGLTGFEFAAGIPGTIGGGCVMNAGAYGGELKDVLVSVTAINPEGEVVTYSVEELEMGYRTSRFLDKNYVILEAKIRLTPGSKEQIEATMAELAFKRRDKQPLELPNAGSTFKRPEGDFAGRLIEEAGLKGKGVGDACVSTKHAGFVVNMGNASAKDVYDTILMVIDAVKAQSGVILEPEVRMIGNFT